MPEKRRFLILGHPRSGTQYMARLMTCFGYSVGHETVSENGVSCWSWATYHPNPPWSPGTRRDDFTEMIHVIREPLGVIASTAYTDTQDCWRDDHTYSDDWKDIAHGGCKSEHFRRLYTVQFPEWSLLDNAAMSYLGWTNLIQAQRPDLTVKVEEAPRVMADYLGEKIKSPPPPTNTNTRKHPPIEIDALRLEVQGAVIRFCKRWGY